jgi:hypothetical protein
MKRDKKLLNLEQIEYRISLPDGLAGGEQKMSNYEVFFFDILSLKLTLMPFLVT